MTFSCPGRLYAKSLLESGELRKDYEEWFVHSDIRSFCEVYEGFDLDLRSGPVIVVARLLRDRNLLFRYSWCATGDQNGRRHVRQEVFLVDSKQCYAMLAGRFVATPNVDLKTFTVETGAGEVLDEILADTVCGSELKVFAHQRNDFELVKKAKQTHLPRKGGASPRMSRAKKQEGESMFKFLSVLFACGCLVGGWYYWTTHNEIRRLETELGQKKSELASCRDRISELQRWVGNRQNFERNVSNMREIFSALKKSVAEAESLMLNIDSTSSSVQRGSRGKTDNKGETLVAPLCSTNVSAGASERNFMSKQASPVSGQHPPASKKKTKEDGGLFGGLF